MRTTLLVVVLLLAACGGGTPPVTGSDALMARDRAFSEYSQAHGFAAAFERFAAPDVVAVFAGAHPVEGRDAVVERLSGGGYTVNWEPKSARVSGSLGVTRGDYTVTPADPEASAAFGHYVTVWERQADGTWLVTTDIGNSTPEP